MGSERLLGDLNGKVVAVTGAAAGIGRSCARAFASAGASVALLDVREDVLQAAVQEMQGAGFDAAGVVVDVSDEQSSERAAAEVIERFGKAHVLLNSAGVFLRGPPIASVSDEIWDWVLGVNLYGSIHAVRAFLPHMLQHGEGGHIINMASLSGLLVGNRKSGVYASSKFALVAYSEALAEDLSGTTVGVSVVLPGAVSTDFYVNSAEQRGSRGEAGEYDKTPADIAGGMSPHELAERVLRGVRAGQFYIVSHPQTRTMVEARHASIMQAYDWAEKQGLEDSE